MTGTNKRMNYPLTFHIRVDKRTYDKLKKIGSKKIRDILIKITKRQGGE